MWNSRATRWIGATAFAVVALVLSLSDRAPRLFKQFRQLAVAAWRAGEDLFAVDLLNRSDIPWAADELGHIALWGMGMVILGLGFRRRVPADVLAAGLFIAGIGVEVLQRVATSGRKMEITDIGANGIGILLGLVVVVAVGAVTPLATSTLSTTRGRRQA